MMTVPLNRTLVPRSHSGAAAPMSHAARAGDPVTRVVLDGLRARP